MTGGRHSLRWILAESAIFWGVKILLVDVLYPILKEVAR